MRYTRDSRIRRGLMVVVLSFGLFFGCPDFSRILVCAGKKQNLTCLYADSGKQDWRMARIWELDRSYSGGIAITRFGTDAWDEGIADGSTPGAGTATLGETGRLRKARRYSLRRSVPSTRNTMGGLPPGRLLPLTVDTRSSSPLPGDVKASTATG